jgi:uncharacterized protein YjbJ (UPF0337 family)
MNWDQIQGKWKQAKGSLKQKWGKLTDDDLDVIAGSRDKFIGKVQERYGIARDEAQKRADEWVKSLRDEDLGAMGHQMGGKTLTGKP